MYSMGAADRVWPCFRETEITYLALAYEFSHGADSLYYWRIGIDAVLIIEVNSFDAETLKTCFATGAYIIRGTLHAYEAPVRRSQNAEFGCEHDLIAAVPDRAADQFLVSPHSIDVGRVEECDAKLDGPMDRIDTLRLAAWPVKLAHAHAAKAKGRDLKP